MGRYFNSRFPFKNEKIENMFLTQLDMTIWTGCNQKEPSPTKYLQQKKKSPRSHFWIFFRENVKNATHSDPSPTWVIFLATGRRPLMMCNALWYLKSVSFYQSFTLKGISNCKCWWSERKCVGGTRAYLANCQHGSRNYQNYFIKHDSAHRAYLENISDIWR